MCGYIQCVFVLCVVFYAYTALMRANKPQTVSTELVVLIGLSAARYC